MIEEAIDAVGGAPPARMTADMSSGNFVAEFHSAINSKVDLLDGAVDQIMEPVRRLPYAPGELDDIKLALAEALANAIVHGNRQNPNKSVQVTLSYATSGELLLAITDEGDGFDPKRVPDPTNADNVFSTHGRGIHLITHLMDTVEYRLGGRQLIMRKTARPPLLLS